MRLSKLIFTILLLVITTHVLGAEIIKIKNKNFLFKSNRKISSGRIGYVLSRDRKLIAKFKIIKQKGENVLGEFIGRYSKAQVGMRIALKKEKKKNGNQSNFNLGQSKKTFQSDFPDAFSKFPSSF